VCFVEDVAAAPVALWGPAIRRDAKLAPNGANVDFVELSDAGEARLRVRTFEKGVEGETYACGTGAVASAVAARLMGHIKEDRVEVEMPGGILVVGFGFAHGEIEDVYLEGPADIVYRGTFEM
jgi:diaminopimelate epimerase